MNHTEFFRALAAGDIAPCYLLEGPEENIKQTAVARLREKLLPAGLEALNESALQNPEADAVIAAAETLPFMAERRLVLVLESGMLAGRMSDEAAQAERLAAYLPKIPPTACVVFVARGKADGRKKLYAALKKHARIVSFDPLSDAEVFKWIARELKGYGKVIAQRTCEQLVFTVGRDTALLAGETAKLAAHAGARAEITPDDIAAVCTRSMECRVFDLTDALVAGRGREAFAMLKSMLSGGEDRMAVLAMVTRQYRQLNALRALLDGGAGGDAAALLGIPPFAARRLAAQARAYAPAQLGKALELCMQADFGVKRGALPQEGALENVMLRLLALKKGETA